MASRLFPSFGLNVSMRCYLSSCWDFFKSSHKFCATIQQHQAAGDMGLRRHRQQRCTVVRAKFPIKDLDKEIIGTIRISSQHQCCTANIIQGGQLENIWSDCAWLRRRGWGQANAYVSLKPLLANDTTGSGAQWEILTIFSA